MDQTAGLARLALTALLAACLGAGLSAHAAPPRAYVTWHPWQADSVLAAWALKRYVAQNAEFESVPNGTPIALEQALDTPDSPYRRNALRTAYEEALRIHRIESQCAERMRPIVRVLELVQWRKAEHPEAESFEAGLLPLLPQQPSRGGLTAAFAYIDQFCSGKGQ